MIPTVYQGTDPFIFVSYSHANTPIALDFIRRLQKAGFRVWYDGGMEPGEIWLEKLPANLEHCGCVIALLTKDFPKSRWCPRELLTADNCGKAILPFYLEPVSDPKLKILLAERHAVHTSNFEDPEEFYRYVFGLKKLAVCRDEVPAAPAPAAEPIRTEVPEPQPDPWTLPPEDDPTAFLRSPDGQILLSYRGSKALVILPEGICSIAEHAFQGNRRLRAIEIPEGVTHMGMGAFSECDNLEAVRLPDSLCQLGPNVFSGCAALTAVHLPDGIRTLPWFAFYRCASLTDVRLPRNLTAIGAQCFGGCAALQAIDLPETLTRLDSEAFSGCIRLEAVTGPAHRNPDAFRGTRFRAE